MEYDNLHERYHFIERHVPRNKNHVINDWCVEQLIIMAYSKIVAVKSITGNSVKMSHHFTNNLWAHALFYICMKTSMGSIIYFRDVLWVKIRLLILDLLSN